jgi:hypothetical protein
MNERVLFLVFRNIYVKLNLFFETTILMISKNVMLICC